MQPFEIKSFCLVVALYICELVNDVETINGLTAYENVSEI